MWASWSLNRGEPSSEALHEESAAESAEESKVIRPDTAIVPITGLEPWMKECEVKNRRGLSTMHSNLMCSLAVLGVHIMIQIASCHECANSLPVACGRHVCAKTCT